MTVTDLSQLAITPLGASIGAEVRGVSLAELGDDGFAAIHEALLTHLVLFFPDQHLDPEAHIEFATRWGQPEIHPFIPKLDDDHPEIVVLRAENGFVADVWHTDCTFESSPPPCSVLNAHVVPDCGGDTMWSNMYLAYERLAEPMKAMLDGLTAINTAANYGNPDTRAEHPVVRVHPETGRRCLFVNEQFTKRIVQLSREESKALLEFLFVHASSTHFTCRYQWSPGTIAVWDNRCTQHCVVNDFEGERVISRVTILGDDDPAPTFASAPWPLFEYGRTSAAASGLDRD